MADQPEPACDLPIGSCACSGTAPPSGPGAPHSACSLHLRQSTWALILLPVVYLMPQYLTERTADKALLLTTQAVSWENTRTWAG